MVYSGEGLIYAEILCINFMVYSGEGLINAGWVILIPTAGSEQRATG